MTIDKHEILARLCYTDLVYDRINKKLKTHFTREEARLFICKVLTETNIDRFTKIGKNIYVSNREHRIKITINSYTFRIITVDRLNISDGNS